MKENEKQEIMNKAGNKTQSITTENLNKKKKKKKKKKKRKKKKKKPTKD